MSHQTGLQTMLAAAYATRPRKPPKRGKAVPQLPKTAEALYVKALRGVVKQIGEATKEILGPHVEAMAAAERTDAAGDVISGLIMDRLKARIADIVSDLAITGIVNHAIEGVNRKNLAEMSRVLGIAPEVLVPGLGETMNAFRTQNVQLIESIGTEYLGQVQEMVTAATTQGIRAEELSRALQERLGVAESRAELIARDQILKANAQMSQTRMHRVGVTRYKWSTSKDSRVREGHRALEGTIQEFANPPVVSSDGRTANPGVDYQCLPGSSLVHRVDGGVLRAFRRSWAGKELVSIITEKGAYVEVTPNHPVLTAAGWKAAKSLKVGDHVFDVRGERGLRFDEHEQDRVPTIEEVFSAADLIGTREALDLARMDFHGDVAHEQVDVVCVDRGLLIDAIATFGEDAAQKLLSDANPTHAGLRAANATRQILGLAPDGIMRGVGEALTFVGAGSRHAKEHGIASAPEWYAHALERGRECYALDSVRERQRIDGFASDVAVSHFLARVFAGVWCRSISIDRPDSLGDLFADRLLVSADSLGNLSVGERLIAKRDRIIDLRISNSRAAHVFNLETGSNWYGASLALHNCRCVALPIFDDEAE